MQDNSSLPPNTKSALALFVKELSDHLSHFQNVLKELDTLVINEKKPASYFHDDVAKNMEQRFHLIRGGASFFKLPVIREKAKEGENLFKGGVMRPHVREEVHQKLFDVITSLKEEEEQLKTSFEQKESS